MIQNLSDTMSDKNSDCSSDDKVNGRQQNGNVDDVCRDYVRNVCKRGKKCRYRHPELQEPGNEVVVVRKPEKVVFCHDYQNTGCRRPSCKFIHCTREEEDYFKSTGQLPPITVQPGPVITAPIIPKQAVFAEMMNAKGDAPICKDFLKGECRRGGKCKYKHLSNAEFDFELRRLDRAQRPSTITRFDAPTFEEVFDRYDHEISLKRRRLDYDDGLDRFHSMVAPSRPFTADYKLLEEENLMLRRRIEELRKQVTDLAATNEVLLEQNARYRVAKSTASLPVVRADCVATSVAQSVVTGQVVTPTISPAPIMTSSITVPRLPPLQNSLPRQCIPSLQQPIALTTGLTTDLAGQQVIQHVQQLDAIAQVELVSQQANLNASLNANLNASLNANLNASLNANLNASLNANLNATLNANLNANVETLNAVNAATLVTPVSLSQTILTPVVSLASVSVQQANLSTVSMPQRSLSQMGLSVPASAAMVSYPIMSMSQAVQRPSSCVP